MAEVGDQAEVAADSGDVCGDGLDLPILDVAVFHPGHADLADAHRLGDLGLGQALLLADLGPGLLT